MIQPMMTPTTNSTSTDEPMPFTLKVQFQGDDIELNVWGVFCARHELMGGHQTWDGKNTWTTYPIRLLRYAEVGDLLRRLNLDPLVHKVWITSGMDD